MSHDFFRFAADVLFPRRCPFCGKMLNPGGALLCPACDEALPRPSVRAAQLKGEFFSKCVSALYYEEDVKNSIHRFKFRGARSYAMCYSQLLAEKIREELEGEFDIITWIPISRRRLRERGYDQSYLLAKNAAGILQVPVRQLVEKIRHTSAQSGLGHISVRRANVSGVFRVVDAGAVAGKRVLLIDDIITTGATLAECSRVLLGAGAARVVCATLARVN